MTEPLWWPTDTGGLMRPSLVVITGAPGSGKTVLVPVLARLLAGAVILDMDWLLGPLSRLAGVDLTVHEPSWPAYGDTWLALAACIGGTGVPVILCGPLLPAELALLPSRALVDQIHCIVLDCADAVRRQRLVARGWDEARIVEAQHDAAVLRQLDAEIVSSDSLSVEEMACVVAGVVRPLLPRSD